MVTKANLNTFQEWVDKMKFNEIEARLEVVTNCILGDILADFDDPEE